MSDPADRPSDPEFLAAVELFARGDLSSDKAADRCGMGRVEFLLAAGRMGVPVVQMDEEELREELSDASSGGSFIDVGGGSSRKGDKMPENLGSHIQKGDYVRRTADTQMVGKVLELRYDEQIEEWTARIMFGSGVRTLPLSEIEPFDVEDADVWSDLERLRFSNARAFRTQMTLERLVRPPSPIASAFGTARARFFPHQFKPVLKFLENPSQRVLVADDVGLGKTIEAGYVLREWKQRQALENVLIVVPARLRPKWKNELSRRFGEEFEIVRTNEIKRVLRRLERAGDLEEFRWIASYESVRDEELIKLFSDLRPGIDLLIMDEAHRVRNRGTDQYRAARALSQCADAIVLLTATPVQTGLDNLYTLVDLLEPNRYRSFSEFEEILEANRPFVRGACPEFRV